jgi:beta-lactamase superfamily II metal-dependent hydrolase
LSDLDLSRNDRSLVLRVCLEKSCLLLTGDLEQRGEQGLLTFGDEITSRVLKVGHHGSRTSTGAEFLQAVNPQLALISAGKDNRFGMPHKEVLARLEQAGIKWFSTERDGQVVIRTDGKEFVTERAARPLH